MSAEPSTPTISLRERSVVSGEDQEKLPKWLLLSLFLHGVLVISLFIVPHLPSPSRPAPPVYTVDLVGGEKIGGPKLGTELFPTSAPKAEKSEPPAPPPDTKKEAKKEKAEKAEKAEKTKAVEKTVSAQEKIALQEATKKEPAKKESTKETKGESKSETASVDSVRERLIQSAVDRVKGRSEKTSKGETISSGPGEGEGAAALGPGGRGGGVVKGIDFIIYYNRMLSTIKGNWVWVGQKSNLKVVVQFGIKDNGEIVGIKIAQPSGDLSYDESVLRAVKKSSPLPALPESYRKDFSDVAITFRPEDLGA